MPRALVATVPRQPAIVTYEDPPLGAHDVRLRTEFAAPKHGTELNLYRGYQRVMEWAYDAALGCFAPRSESAVRAMFPRPLGNMAAGVVTEVGAEVTRFRPGDQAFGHLPIRETQTAEESRLWPLPVGLSPAAAVCLDPAVMAFALRDAAIKLGDQVAVFGLGAIGLMAVQLARLNGAAQVIAVDPIAPRRELALRFGADAALDPEGDGGLAVRRAAQALRDALPGPATAPAALPPVPILGGYREVPSQWSNLGVDVAIEVSGSPRALHDAIRATRFGGTICLLSYYGTDSAGLKLGEEFHVNRQTLISCRAESLPLRDGPGWTLERISQTCLHWLASGRLNAAGLVSPVVPFEQSADAYREIDEHPQRSIKLGIRFD